MNHEAFLQRIVEESDDVAARLVYADWLDDRGDAERAEFIRVQCELAKWTDEDGWMPMGLGRETLRSRQKELLIAHGVGWAAPLASVFGLRQPCLNYGYGGGARDRLRWDWRRGFVEQFECAADDWLRHGPAVVRLHPVVEVKLADKDSSAGYLSGYGPTWSWFSPDMQPNGEKDNIPAELFAWLVRLGLGDFMGPEDRRRGGVYFGSEADARAALSEACVEYARRESGLPPRRKVTTPPESVPSESEKVVRS